VRIIGAATEEAARLAQGANSIVEEEIEKAAAEGSLEMPWQYFAIVLPVKTVGVHGDLRVYGYTIAVRAVDSVDGMSASFSKLPSDVLETISTRITNELKNVNRVIYDITHKPPGTIEWE
jgi:GMP synthase (glutamine-hydrolysing)